MKTGYGSGRPKYHKSKGAGSSESTAFIGMQLCTRTKGSVNCCTEAQIYVNSKESTEWVWTFEYELVNGSTLDMGSIDARTSEDEGIFEGFLDVIKQKRGKIRD